MTGQEFDKLFDLKTDNAYSAYLDTAKRTRLYRIALYEAIEQKYQSGDKQKIYDELFGIIKTEEPSTTITSNEAEINDYLHLLALKTRFTKTVGTISAVTNPNTITITGSQLRTGMKVVISGATGSSGLNGDSYIKKVGINKYKLYTNKALDIERTVTGTYNTNTGTLKIVYEKWGKPLFSDRKFSPYSEATIQNPYYEEAVGLSGQKVFKIYPADEAANLTEVYFDFIANPTLFIDPTDNTDVLTDAYNEKFLYYVLDTAAKLFAGPTRDQVLYQLQTKEIIDNP